MASTTVDPAKVRQYIRNDLADLAIAEAVADELANLADDKRREASGIALRIGRLFAYLGRPPIDAPRGREHFQKMLDELEAAAKTAGGDEIPGQDPLPGVN